MKTILSTKNIIIIFLIIISIFFGIKYLQNARIESVKTEQEMVNIQQRLEIVQFMKFFINSVIKTNNTVSFEDRLKLESDIMKIGDQELISQWEVFISSTDTQTAETSAAKLVNMLADKII